MLLQLAAQLGPPSIIGKHLTWKRACNHLSCSVASGFLTRSLEKSPTSTFLLTPLFGALEVCTPGHITLRFGVSEICVFLWLQWEEEKKEDGESELA